MITVLFSLLRYAVCGNCQPDKALAEKELDRVLALAKDHDVAHLIAHSMEKLGVKNGDLQREKALAILRTEKLKFATAQVCTAFEGAKIRHVLLKGAQLRSIYPEAWMRTSCDLDVYVDPKDLDTASEALLSSGFKMVGKNSHDVSFYAPNGCHIELHYAFIEDEVFKDTDGLFGNVFENSVKETEFRYLLTDELFYLYHIAHMAKHVKNGGCGIRPFLDLWLLCHKLPQNAERQKLCEKYGLKQFEETSRALSEAWFSGEEHNERTRNLSEYIIGGKVYGTLQNSAAIQQNKHKGKGGYVLSRLFMPYGKLIYKYPSLEGRPWLMPIYTVRRWFTLFNGKVSDRVKKELTVEQESVESLSSLMKELGL